MSIEKDWKDMFQTVTVEFNLAPKGPFCFLPTEPETMPGARHALDFSAARRSNIGSGSARVE